jgi:phosphate transport system substrate-binding protein
MILNSTRWFSSLLSQRFTGALGAALLAGLLVLTGCGRGDAAQTVRVDGSSTVFPISRAAVTDYQQENPDARIVAGNSGTSAGFQRFFRNETDVTGASRPIREDELRRAEEEGVEFIELPIGYDGLTITTHPTNDFVSCLTVSELNAIWREGSTVEQWSDIRDSFPDKELRLYGRSPASGTYDYFTEAINGERGNIRDEYNASDTDNAVVQGVSRDESGMAFFGLSYYENNSESLRLLAVDNEQGEGCVRPTQETVANGTYQPLARPEFIYVHVDRMQDNPEVAPFVRHYIANAQRFVRQAEYIPFESEVYDLVMQRFENRVTGSMFEGSGPKIGVRIGDLLERMNEDSASAPSDTTAVSSDTTNASS